MADHLRKQIRDAAATTLTGLATTGTRVFASRVYPLQEADLPALRVDTNNEDVDSESIVVNRVLDRTVQLLVQACVKQNTAYNDTIDQIIKEVEVALSTLAAQTMAGAKSVQLLRIEVVLAGEGEKPVAVATMLFAVPYHTALNAPDVAL